MVYAELHCKTNFSFLEGAAHAEELVRRARELDYAALAVTDRNSLAGVVRAHLAARTAGLKLLIGAEIHPCDGLPVVFWAPDRQAYGRLSRMITVGRRQAEKGQFALPWQQLAEYSQGLLAAVLPERLEGADVERQVVRHRELFGDRGYLLAALHRGPADGPRLAQAQALARRTRVPLLAAGDVLYHIPERQALQEVLTAIRHGLTVSELAERRFPNAQRALRTPEELQRLFAAAPDALRRTQEVADRCQFSLDQLRYEYPEELAPQGLTPAEYLRQLTWRGAARRYPQGIPPKVRQLLQHELALIEDLRYEAYFLTVWDLVRFARRRGILCQGRGSAANSAVCYCLGVTSVDPDRADVLFERFVSRERNEAPDIDVDFEHARREEVLQYIYEKYGRERAGMTAVVITYRTRSAIRDVGKALGLSLDRVDGLAKNIDGYHHQPQLAERCRQIGLEPESPLGRRLIYLIQEILGFPRHLSQHVGGMVITQGPLCELAPIENAAMPGRTVLEWDKDDLDELGILKVDCLALGMLTAIHKCFDSIRQARPAQRLTLANIPAEDPRVYDMVCRADTIGVFQIESRAQMSMLPRLRPRCFYDLVIEVAIVRPGPIQGEMVHPYLRRRAGHEAVTYPNDALRQVLEKTLGVPLFQEQAMRLAVIAAGFTPGEADQLRRAMAAWRRPGVIDQFRTKLISGMQARGLSAEFAQQVFQQIRGFGEYGFPESHAASFALLVYVSAWLKHYYPTVFTAALINSQPMGFYAPAQLIRDLHDRGGKVLPIDVNHSAWDCTLEAPTGDVRGTRAALRLGLRLITWLPQSAAEKLEQARAAGPFRSIADLARRTRLGHGVLSKLADADAFGSLHCHRRQALWDTLNQKRDQPRPLLEGLVDDEEPAADLPPLQPLEEVLADYRATSLSLKAHPLSFYRAALRDRRLLTAAQLSRVPNNRRVQVAGLVLLRQRPSTARGITFVTLEDETGTANLVVHPQTWDQFDRVARRSPAWMVSGRLECKDSVIHVIVQQIVDLGDYLREAATLRDQNPVQRIERRFR
jgi:error-prone DNA polymerase